MTAALGLLPLDLPPLEVIEEDDRRPRRGRRGLTNRPRCKECRHPIRVDLSLEYKLGPKCAKKLGVERSFKALRLGRVRSPGDIKGQQLLFQVVRT
ncbi:hypothetical protein [Herbidospora mongoliensis]|uniref:hypothetical protein n=1 Tax=Herbidospora mongoliensis TaxID=688067 RepID=UPI00082BF62F|nr:hypothetical protein [Herbidospora mongoliensis]